MPDKKMVTPDMTDMPSPKDMLRQAMDFYRVGRLDKANAAYDAVLDRDPDNYEALEWRGEIAIQQDDYETAVECLQRCRELDPARFGEFSNLGLACYELEYSADAVEALRRAIEIDPNDLIAHSNLGRALYDYFHAGHEDEARDIARAWVEKFPDNPDAAHMGAAVGGLEAPEKAVEAYVADIFDTFAPDFDEKLEELGYKAPQLLQDLIERHAETDLRGLSVLDAGCGTGLCAPLLKPWASRLDGVDLSAKMLEKADARGLYDRLETAELVEDLSAHAGEYDLIVAADVLCYFGALETVFAETRAALKGPSRFAFSLERAQADVTRYHLHPSGRYSHNPAYVRDALKGAGLTLVAEEDVVLRSEYGADVHGIVVLAEAG